MFGSQRRTENQFGSVGNRRDFFYLFYRYFLRASYFNCEGRRIINTCTIITGRDINYSIIRANFENIRVTALAVLIRELLRFLMVTRSNYV